MMDGFNHLSDYGLIGLAIGEIHLDTGNAVFVWSARIQISVYIYNEPLSVCCFFETRGKKITVDKV